MRVLLVDDSDAVRATTGALLEDAGHSVVAVDSLAAARRVFAQEPSPPFDLALLDLTLQDGSGTALVPELRRRHPSAAIVIITGGDDALSDHGVDLVLRKGGDPMALVRRLEEAVAARRTVA
jgi:DNA-binding response OmpR family regulator